MKKFLKFCACEIINVMIIFDIIFYVVGMISISVELLQLGITVLLSCVLTILCVIFVYMKNRDYFEQLYTKVCMSYKARDEYINYVEIKKIITTYEFNGELDVKRNVAVIQAAIERDKSNNVFWSALLTIAGVILGLESGKDIFVDWYMMIYLLLFIVYMQIGRNIPRNSFIKKVLETLVDD